MSAATPLPAYVPDVEQRRAPELDPELERQIADRRARILGGIFPRRDRVFSLALGVSFLLVAVPLLLATSSTRHPNVLTVLLLVGLYGLVSRVYFEIGAFSAVPTELVLVPMFFTLPPAAVPLCVAAGFLVRDPVAFVRGRLGLERTSLRMASSWHALGPAIVFVVAGARAPRWTDWPLYVVALGAQFALNFAVDWIREEGLGAKHSSLRSQTLVYAVDAALAPIGLLIAFASASRPWVLLFVLPLAALLQLFAREREQRIDAALELGHAYRGTAMLLGDVVEADDAYTGEHSRDVVSLTLAVCDWFDLDARDRRNAEFVALLHDIGKIRIPSEIINKPGPLDDDERAVIETHTLEGEAMLTKIGGLLGDVGRIVRSCHERWDGGGYPDGLAGEAIPLIARIVCCTDALSAMTTTRPYRKARPVEDALAELRRCAGTHFDPEVVEAVCAVATER